MVPPDVEAKSEGEAPGAPLPRPRRESVVPGYPGLDIALQGRRGAHLEPGVAVLGGDRTEALFGAARAIGQRGPMALFRAEGWLLGAASVAVTPGLEEVTHALYTSLLAATAGWHLARIWNYVPALNAANAAGQENYQQFCRGRARAFEAYHGTGFTARLPAASAVGSEAARLTVVFAACPAPPRHVENPLQVPAYAYPPEYGPRAPSFARATVVAGPANHTIFISGTAAIRGHATIAPDSLPAQLACTLENLRGIAAACGLGADLARDGAATRHFKIYLRRAGDRAEVAERLEAGLLQDRDRVTYLRADLCRAPLLVEIEASLFGVETA